MTTTATRVQVKDNGSSPKLWSHSTYVIADQRYDISAAVADLLTERQGGGIDVETAPLVYRRQKVAVASLQKDGNDYAVVHDGETVGVIPENQIDQVLERRQAALESGAKFNPLVGTSLDGTVLNPPAPLIRGLS